MREAKKDPSFLLVFLVLFIHMCSQLPAQNFTEAALG